MNVKKSRYYIVNTEWLYPTESGRDIHNDTYDTMDEALKICEQLCYDEYSNFIKNCGDCLKPQQFNDYTNGIGYIITTKNGLDKYYFAARITIQIKIDN